MVEGALAWTSGLEHGERPAQYQRKSGPPTGTNERKGLLGQKRWTGSRPIVA